MLLLRYRDLKDRPAETLDRVGLTHRAHHRAHALSGGERQRISLARALLKGTDLLIFDEPGNNLDPTALAWMADYIKNCDKTVIVVTHDELLQQAANKTLRLAKS